MSSYFKYLDWQGKERYRKKLESVGLTLVSLQKSYFSPIRESFLPISFSAIWYFGYKDLKTLRWASPPLSLSLLSTWQYRHHGQDFSGFPLRTNIMDAKAILKVTKAWKRSHLVASFWVWGINFIPSYHPTSIYTINSNTHCTRCIEIRHFANVAKRTRDQCSIFSMVQ